MITLGEIMRGIELKQRKDSKAAAILAEWLIALRELHRETILPVSEAVALEWGRLAAEALAKRIALFPKLYGEIR